MPIKINWSYFPREVRTRDDVVQLSRGMLLHDVNWHWEDDQSEMVFRDGSPVFTPEDAERLNLLCEQMCELSDDVAESYCCDMAKLHLKLGAAAVKAWKPSWSDRFDDPDDWDSYLDWVRHQLAGVEGWASCKRCSEQQCSLCAHRSDGWVHGHLDFEGTCEADVLEFVETLTGPLPREPKVADAGIFAVDAYRRGYLDGLRARAKENHRRRNPMRLVHEEAECLGGRRISSRKLTRAKTRLAARLAVFNVSPGLLAVIQDRINATGAHLSRQPTISS